MQRFNSSKFITVGGTFKNCFLRKQEHSDYRLAMSSGSTSRCDGTWKGSVADTTPAWRAEPLHLVQVNYSPPCDHGFHEVNCRNHIPLCQERQRAGTRHQSTTMFNVSLNKQWSRRLRRDPWEMCPCPLQKNMENEAPLFPPPNTVTFGSTADCCAVWPFCAHEGSWQMTAGRWQRRPHQDRRAGTWKQAGPLRASMKRH